jgi:hypothetical protein
MRPREGTTIMFAGSRYIRDLYEPVAEGDFRSAVAEAFTAARISPDQELLDRLCIQPLGIRYVKWRRVIDRLQALNLRSDDAQALRRFVFAQHVLIDIPGGSPFDPDTAYPGQLPEIAAFGAKGLLDHGREQVRSLRSVCDSLVGWARDQGHRRVLLLESPLGNVVPVAILSILLRQAGVDSTTVSLSLPRDTRIVMFKDAIESLYAGLTKDPLPLLYLDDVLTGSRFSKVVDALQKAARRHRQPLPVAVALVFQPHRPLTPAHVENRERARAKVSAERHPGDPPVWWQVPGLPQIRIDSGPPVSYESPVVWGESDLVAGRRRVNLVFNLIEEFKRIQDALVAEAPAARTELRRLWSEDVNGHRYDSDDAALRGGLAEAFRGLDWEAIAAAAEKEFPDDYQGRATVRPDAAFAGHRTTWLRGMILGATAGPAGTQLGWEALYALFLTLDRREGDPRDRDFCYMFYPYNPAIARLHHTIVETVAR